jgi:hypothetical protein
MTPGIKCESFKTGGLRGQMIGLHLLIYDWIEVLDLLAEM